MTTELTVATWNIMWANGSSARGRRVRNILREVDADLLIVTEGQRDLLPEGGHIVDAGSDWGYDITKSPERRKTMLWSRKPLTDVTTVPSGAGAGRVLVAHTDTPLGQVRVLAVCIPWASAHVSTGRRDASNWSEHLECCDHIEVLTAGFDPRIPTIVAGDFNQRLPRVRQPIRVHERLLEVLDRWTPHTAGDVRYGPLIDHIASDLSCINLRTWSGTDDVGRLSDHSGVTCTLVRRDS
ncbi:endonuclease/exonuclease/phosphatase family protein [Gordonia westfalica]|uniref:Endonuclease/exonuclease/phosphatase family protein n=1 Tax=Gordonia westfalica TaxID=158898 RepID=A0ABU2GS03_9ACTN|nr:endonuclease/exonuclease/phosphatase family protein [Gordonia westfalica]MDS1114238.1 endonuclease/exonuclease/phosphatase family protein [Gordonia westfalica]